MSVRIKSEIPSPPSSSLFKRPSSRVDTLPEYQIVLEKLSFFPEVKEKIVAGWPPFKVADFYYDQHIEEIIDKGLTKERFSDFITSYRKKITPAEMVAIRMPEEIIKAKEKLGAGVNILAEMESLYTIQKDRIELDYKTEKKLGKLFKTTGNEIAIASQLLRDLAQLKVDLGLDKADAQIDDTTRQRLINDFGLRYGKESVAKVLNDSKAVSKILSVTESLFKNLKSDEAVKMIEEVTIKQSTINKTINLIT
ncbi:MAG: hypothetical protein K8F60_18440 [Melioribacteraceae bacterium]|jgi:hypothetical protein|nr:hypothetical protein [Melioribacteraceae bacterium]